MKYDSYDVFDQKPESKLFVEIRFGESSFNMEGGGEGVGVGDGAQDATSRLHNHNLHNRKHYITDYYTRLTEIFVFPRVNSFKKILKS